MQDNGRMIQSPDKATTYRWYYDVKYGQDKTVIKVSAGICAGLMLTMVLMALLMPGAKMSVWEVIQIQLIVSAGVMAIAWGINALMYRLQGGKNRLHYVLTPSELTVSTSIRIAKGVRALGGAVTAAGILAGSAGGALTGAGMSGFSSRSVVILGKATRIVFHRDRDLIGLWCGPQYCQIYVHADDFESLKAVLLDYTPRTVTVVER